MRNALILLAVVALVILAVGALNNETAFDVDYVAGTVSAVSLFWVSVVLAALVFVVGLAAAWFAQAAMAGSRRKLEAELQSTYERLREAESLAAQRGAAAEAAASAAAAEAAAAEPVAVIVPEAAVAGREAEALEAGEEATVVAGEDVTIVADEAATVVVEEPETVVAEEAETVAEAGEATAVTMTGAAPEAEQAQPADAAGDADAAANGADQEPGSSGS